MKFSFDNTKSLVLVSGVLHGPDRAVTVLLGLDAGATKTCLSPASLFRVGLFIHPFGETASLNTANGVIQIPVTEISGLRCLGQTKFNLKIHCHAFSSRLGIDGLLGLDFLQNLDLHIDFRNGTIELL